MKDYDQVNVKERLFFTSESVVIFNYTTDFKDSTDWDFAKSVQSRLWCNHNNLCNLWICGRFLFDVVNFQVLIKKKRPYSRMDSFLEAKWKFAPPIQPMRETNFNRIRIQNLRLCPFHEQRSCFNLCQFVEFVATFFKTLHRRCCAKFISLSPANQLLISLCYLFVHPPKLVIPKTDDKFEIHSLA
jgi:hypothetical protein